MGPATPNHHHADLLSHCFQEAERRVPELTRRCIEAMLSSLQAAEGASLHNRQRQLFARATISLAQNRMVLIQTYPRRLSARFDNRSTEPDLSDFAELSDSSMLQLVDDAAVNESLESVRLLQNLLPLVEHALPILDARMSSLIGLDTVAVEKNPLRPSVFARELRDLMAEVESDGDVRSLWMQHIAHVLGRELGQLYEQLALMLQQANVQEASYRIRLVEDPEASRAVAASASAASVPDLLAEQGVGRGRRGKTLAWPCQRCRRWRDPVPKWRVAFSRLSWVAANRSSTSHWIPPISTRFNLNTPLLTRRPRCRCLTLQRSRKPCKRCANCRWWSGRACPYR
jgi:hypothetical protein